MGAIANTSTNAESIRSATVKPFPTIILPTRSNTPANTGGRSVLGVALVASATELYAVFPSTYAIVPFSSIPLYIQLTVYLLPVRATRFVPLSY